MRRIRLLCALLAALCLLGMVSALAEGADIPATEATGQGYSAESASRRDGEAQQRSADLKRTLLLVLISAGLVALLIFDSRHGWNISLFLLHCIIEVLLSGGADSDDHSSGGGGHSSGGGGHSSGGGAGRGR